MVQKLCRLVVPAALCGALMIAGTASAATLRGVVVHQNHHAHSFVVSQKGGHLASVHARRSPRLGRTVKVTALRLHNGTWLAQTVSSGRRARRATVRGVVTFVDRKRGLFTLSAGGASLLIHRHRVHGARTADALPNLGENVTIQAGIDDQGNLDEEAIHDNGAQTSNIEIEGVVMAVDPTARTISVSADDDSESGQAIVVSIPATFDITGFTVGQEVKLLVSQQPDQSFLLQGSAEDDNSQAANNPSDSQGLGGGCGDSHDGSGGSGGGGGGGCGSGGGGGGGGNGGGN
jgi:uncharacterized membrane protein YgcG